MVDNTIQKSISRFINVYWGWVMSEVTAEVSGLTRLGGMVKGKVTITFDSDIVIGYSGNASDEVLKGYLKDAAIEQLKYEVQSDD